MTNNQTTLDEVRRKVIEACPDIMELKFGCILSDGYDIATIIKADGAFWYLDNDKKFNRVALLKGYDEPRVLLGGRSWSSLGHPIGIAEVLRTVADKIEGYSYFAVTTDGTFIHGNLGDGKDCLEHKKVWDLRYDLDWHIANRPEVVEWLCDIICK